jgi:hypothetical protein
MGGGNKAAEAAQQQENQRQAQIGQSVNQIDTAFANRQPQYDKYLNATRSLYNTELGRQQQVATRGQKFALARNGLTGSSVAADQGDELGREMAQGTISAEQKAQGALSNLQSQDNAERLQLISLAQSGSDIGNANQQATDALRANLGSAMSSNVASGLGDIFSGVSDSYKNTTNAAMAQRGINNARQNLYGTNSAKAAGGGP